MLDFNFKLSTLVLLPCIALLAGCPPVLDDDDDATGGAGDDCTWTVQNNIDFDPIFVEITGVHLAETGTDTWGGNLLGTDTIAYQAGTIIAVQSGTWDLQAVDEDGDTYTFTALQCVDGEDQTVSVTENDIDPAA